MYPVTLPGPCGLEAAGEGTEIFLQRCVRVLGNPLLHPPPGVICQTRSVLLVPSAASGSWEAFVLPLRYHEPSPTCAMIQKFTVLQKFLVALGTPLGGLVRPQRA